MMSLNSCHPACAPATIRCIGEYDSGDNQRCAGGCFPQETEEWLDRMATLGCSGPFSGAGDQFRSGSCVSRNLVTRPRITVAMENPCSAHQSRSCTYCSAE